MGRIDASAATRRVTRRGLAVLGTTTALLIGVLATGVQSSGAAVLEVSNVGASMTAPTSAAGAFGVTATITNTGTLPQISGATVTISATNGAVTAAPGCQMSGGTAVCTLTEAMSAGTSRTYAATVTPSGGAGSVVTKVVTKANQPDLNAPTSPADDTVSKATTVEVSNVAASLTAPAVTTGAFAAVATITNSGNVNQAAGSTVTISAAGGNVTAVGCTQTNPSKVVCTAGALTPGQAQSFNATVLPAVTPSVATTAVTQANQADANAPGSPADDTVSRTTNHYALDLNLTNDPIKVKPGNDTRLDAAVTNNGTPQTGVSLTIDTGGVIDTRLPVTAGCSVGLIDRGKLTCTGIAIGLGETVHIVAAVTTPLIGVTTMHSAAAVTGQHGSGDNDAVDTAIDPDAKDAFVPPGAGVCSTESHESTCFRTPSTWEGGTVVGLHQQYFPGTMCGTQPCSPYIVEALWPKSANPAHNDPNNPLILHITYSTKQNCNGGGWGSGCHQLYWMNSIDEPANAMPQCSTFRVSSRIPAVMSDVNTPCLNYIQRNSQGIVTYEVAILIDTLIPKISL